MSEFEECMDRLFTSLASNKTFRSMNRLDLFEILFNDRQNRIKELKKENKLLREGLEYIKNFDRSDLHNFEYYTTEKVNTILKQIDEDKQ